MGGLFSSNSHVMNSDEFAVANDITPEDSSEESFPVEEPSNKISRVLREELFEVTNDNGYIFCGKYYIPEELLSMILSYVEPKDLVFNCRRTCKTWCNVIDSQVWRLKFQRINYVVPKIQELPWFACYWIFTKKTLNRNLIKNGCGQENLQHWKIITNGGDRWKAEKPPSGSEKFPENADEEVLKHNSCFVTSFWECAKEQVIDLADEGATPEFMDVIRPNITVSEWYAGRFDCLSVYQLRVALLNEDKLPICDEEESDDAGEYENHLRANFLQRSYLINNRTDTKALKRLFMSTKRVGAADGNAWHKVTHVFENIEPGVRYIKFVHIGKDSQFWKGHYGSKMTGASVVLSLPKNFVDAS